MDFPELKAAIRAIVDRIPEDAELVLRFQKEGEDMRGLNSDMVFMSWHLYVKQEGSTPPEIRFLPVKGDAWGFSSGGLDEGFAALSDTFGLSDEEPEAKGYQRFDADGLLVD